MKKKGYTYFSGFIALCFCIVLVLGVTGPAQAHDGVIGGYIDGMGDPQFTAYEIFDSPFLKNYNHTDQDPWKGFFMIYTLNNTGSAWTGMHFTSLGGNADFIDTSSWDSANPANPCSNWAYDLSCNPVASGNAGVNSWIIGSDKDGMNVYFNNAVEDGSAVWVRVYTDNTSSQGNFSISVNPILVPEPISSILFIIGAGTLGARRFWKKRKTA